MNRLALREKRLFPHFLRWPLILLLAGAPPACGIQKERRGIPPEIESAVLTIGDDLAAEQYEEIYRQASDLWRQDSTLEQSTEVLKAIRTKLGRVESRILLSATEQQNSGEPLKGHVFIVTYQTRFERGPGMETFTFIERDHQWLLARYFVNSTELK